MPGARRAAAGSKGRSAQFPCTGETWIQEAGLVSTVLKGNRALQGIGQQQITQAAKKINNNTQGITKQKTMNKISSMDQKIKS